MIVIRESSRRRRYLINQHVMSQNSLEINITPELIINPELINRCQIVMLNTNTNTVSHDQLN